MERIRLEFESKENQMKNDFKDLKETLQSKTIDLNKILDENVQLHQLLSDETEINLKNSSSSNFFEKQFEELNERHVQLQNQFNELQIEHESLVLFNQKLEFEYKQTKSTLEDCRNKVRPFFSFSSSLLFDSIRSVQFRNQNSKKIFNK